MNILNLAYDTQGSYGTLKHEISKFPDGQQSITIDPTRVTCDEVTIHTRLNSFKDVELVVCATVALRNLGVEKIHLYAPYFLGGRSDRKFIEGSVNYIKDVIAPIINNLNFKSVTVFDPHSDVLEACLNNFKKISNVSLAQDAIEYLTDVNSPDDIVIVSPDAGALKKIYTVAESLSCNNVVIASKHRDITTGKITHTDVPGLEKYDESKKFIIVDDICDGGRTFVEIAKKIEETFKDASIYLIISHGIFSSGFEELSKYFTKIFTTDSICSLDELDSVIGSDIVKQFSIFKTNERVF